MRNRASEAKRLALCNGFDQPQTKNPGKRSHEGSLMATGGPSTPRPQDTEGKRDATRTSNASASAWKLWWVACVYAFQTHSKHRCYLYFHSLRLEVYTVYTCTIQGTSSSKQRLVPSKCKGSVILMASWWQPSGPWTIVTIRSWLGFMLSFQCTNKMQRNIQLVQDM